MPKTHRTIQQWDRWLKEPLGQHVLSAEKNFLKGLLKEYYGKHALLIGVPRQQVLLKSSVMSYHLLLSPLQNHLKNAYYIESHFYELPVASGSIDLVILPHILECVDNPHHLLAEACRIVKPEGHIIICGFNPYSLWGCRAENFVQVSLVKQWLKLADFELVKQFMLLFRPPIVHEGIYQKLKFLEWMGRKCFSPLGGVYLLVAQAKVTPLTPIRLRWQQKLASVRIPTTIGISGTSIRNYK